MKTVEQWKLAMIANLDKSFLSYYDDDDDDDDDDYDYDDYDDDDDKKGRE